MEPRRDREIEEAQWLAKRWPDVRPVKEDHSVLGWIVKLLRTSLDRSNRAYGGRNLPFTTALFHETENPVNSFIGTLHGSTASVDTPSLQRPSRTGMPSSFRLDEN